MGYISRDVIEKVRELARVEEVIAEFVPLKRSGSNLRGYSPFNKENTPSFFVSPAKQIWKDFSSGKGGDVVKFLMEHEKFTYPEAIRWLAEKYGIEIVEKEPDEAEIKEREERDSRFVVMEFARKWFMEQLYRSDEGKSVGLSYFKGRGFLEKTLKTFDIGYSPAQRDAFYQAAVKAGYKPDLLEQAGLIIRKNDKIFDRFFERVIFPIRSLSGRVVGFAGRILDSTKKTAKYLNSPETEIYHKSRVLYGLYQARTSIVKENACFLVEGYTDVMAFHQAGILNTVASAGTALTAEQIRLIKRFTPNIVLVYDGDPAGLKAALRGVDIILENDMNVRVVILPEGEDPDSFAKKTSSEDLTAYLETNARDFIEFKTELLLHGNNDPLKVHQLIKEVLDSISVIPDEIKRRLYVRKIAEMTGLDEQLLYAELVKLFRKNLRKKSYEIEQSFKERGLQVSETRRPSVNFREVLEREIIKALLLYGNERIVMNEYTPALEDGHVVTDENGNFVANVTEISIKIAEKIYLDLQEDEIEFTSPLFRNIYEKLISQYQTEGQINPQKLIAELPPGQVEEISDILMSEEKYHLSDWKKRKVKMPDKYAKLGDYIINLIYSLRLELIKEHIRKEKEKLKEASPEDEHFRETLQQIMLYDKYKQFLGSILHRVIL